MVEERRGNGSMIIQIIIAVIQESSAFVSHSRGSLPLIPAAASIDAIVAIIIYESIERASGRDAIECAAFALLNSSIVSPPF